MRFVTAVREHVPREPVVPGKTLPTPANSALVRLFAGVPAQVPLEITRLSEGCFTPAEGALERLLARVESPVLGEVVLVLERLVAVRALVGALV